MSNLKRELRSKSRPELLDIAIKSGLTELETDLIISRICKQHSRDRSAMDLHISYSCATDHYCNALKKIESWFRFNQNPISSI